MRASMLYLMTSQLFWIEVILFAVLGSSYIWMPQYVSMAWGFIIGFSIGWPAAWIYQEIAKKKERSYRSRSEFLKTITIIAILLASCTTDDQKLIVEQENYKKTREHKALSTSDITGNWHFDEETAPMNWHLAANPLHIEPISKTKLLLNGVDTVCLQGPDQYYACMSIPSIISGSMANGVLTHCQLYPDPVTQSSYYVCINYTR